MSGKVLTPEALLSETRALIDQKRSRKALKKLHRHLKKHSEGYGDARLLMMAGIALFRLGDFRRARACFQRALLKSRRNVYAVYYLGLTYERQHLLPEALVANELAFAWEPGFHEARYKIDTITSELNQQVALEPGKTRSSGRKWLLVIFRPLRWRWHPGRLFLRLAFRAFRNVAPFFGLIPSHLESKHGRPWLYAALPPMLYL